MLITRERYVNKKKRSREKIFAPEGSDTIMQAIIGSRSHCGGGILEHRAPGGTRDILPPEVHLWQRVEAKARAVAEHAAYREIRTPIFEHTELFVRGIGEASEVVQKQMYTFQTPGNESLTLRPEITAPVIRAYLQHSMHKTGAFRKLYYLGPSFRYERAQKGRWRQFSQFGIEAIGSCDPLVDVETIVVGWDILAECGVPGLKLLLNSIGCPDCRPAYREALKEYVGRQKGNLCKDCQRRAQTNILRILDCKEEGCKEAMKDVPQIPGFLCGNCAAHFEKVRQGVQRYIPDWELDPHLVRGLDYYTHTVYEFVAGELGAQNAVGGGGRYDLLVEELGGPRTPSVGFALGLDRIVLSIKSVRSELPAAGAPVVFFVAVTDELRPRVQEMVVSLRRRSIPADMDYEGRSVKAQFRAANKSGARFVAVLGPEEVARGMVNLKTLATGAEEQIPEDKLADMLTDA
jgi:histidyl-tRNA synthetase